MSNDKRQHRRFDVRWRGRVATADKKLFDVIVNDVSIGGVAIVFPYAVPVGTRVSIEFYARPREESKRIRAKTVVVFNTVLSANRGAKLGLQFDSMSKEDLHTLKNVLQTLEDDAF